MIPCQDLRPRELLHRGSVLAAGLLFDLTGPGWDRAQARILAAWQPGSRVCRLGDRLLLLWPAPLRVRCELAPGLPLVRQGELLTSAPLSSREVAALGLTGSGWLILVHQGQAEILALIDGVEEEPANWLEIESIIPIQAESLGEPPRPLPVTLTPAAADTRAALGGVVPPADPRVAQLVTALQRARREKELAHQIGRSPVESQDSTAEPGLLATLLGRLLHRLGTWLSPGPATTDAPPRLPPPAPAAPFTPAPPPTTWWTRLGRRLQAQLTGLLMTSRLGGLLGRRQARYLARMLELFEEGDLDEALRHAIPLESDPAAPAGDPWLGVPTRREELALTRPSGGASSSLFLAPDLMALIRQRYQLALQRLERLERYEEAAFVLAELLGDRAGAAALLERHGKLAEAARLAETLGLEPGLIIRLWFLAGERERAVTLARQTGAFADAIERLVRSKHAEQAQHLRLLWAELLASTGRFAQAVDTIWPDPASRRLARAWIDAGLAQGGVGGARLLARKLRLWPETLPAVRQLARPLLLDCTPEQARERLAFTEELLRQSSGPDAQVLGRLACRAVLRDRGRQFTGQLPDGLTRLLLNCNDPSLIADCPPIPPLTPTSAALRARVGRDEAGLLPIHDLALLPAGQLLLALGELGVRLVSREGRTVAHFDEPAQRLVVADEGSRALALIRRGGSWNVAQLELLRRQSQRWGAVRLEAFATACDGAGWFIAQDGALLLLDLLAPTPHVLWRVGQLPGTLRHLRWSRGTLQLLLRTEGTATDLPTAERWTYRFPGPTLRDRTRLPDDHPACGFRPFELEFAGPQRLILFLPELAAPLLPRSRPGYWPPPQPEAPAPRLVLPVGSLELSPDARLCGRLQVEENRLALPIIDRDGPRLDLLELPHGRLVARIELVGAQRISTRFADGRLAIGDDLGRVVVVDPELRQVLRILRIG